MLFYRLVFFFCSAEINETAQLDPDFLPELLYSVFHYSLCYAN